MLSDNIALYRRRKGLSQEQLAQEQLAQDKERITHSAHVLRHALFRAGSHRVSLAFPIQL